MIDINERAQIIYDELHANARANPAAWLAEALKAFEREIRNDTSTGGRDLQAENAAALFPDLPLEEAIRKVYGTKSLAMAAIADDKE